MPIADWWVEYYDRVGEHGSHQAYSKEHAVRDAKKLSLRAKRHPEHETWYTGIYDYNNQEGTVYQATQDYLDLLKERAPERGMDEFMDAIVRFLETGRPAEYAFPSVPNESRSNPTWTRDERMSRLMEFVDGISRNEWGERVDKMNSHEIQELEDAASQLSQIAAELGFYLMMRGAAGTGDHGNDKAFEYARKRLKAVRRAIGYSYP